MDIRHKRIVLTGAGAGIGAEILKQLMTYEGVRIIAADLRAENIAPAEGVTPYTCDVGDVAQVDGLFDYANEVMGGVDIFIANAGFAYYERMGAVDWAQIDNIYRVNTYSPIYSVLKMRDMNGEREHLTVITASSMALLGVPGYALYGGTKAALHRWVDAYRFELTANQRLMVVYPIATRTRFFENTQAGKKSAPVLFPSQTAGYVAGQIVRGIERNATQIHPSVLFNLLRVTQGLFGAFGAVVQWVYGRQFRQWER